MSVPPQGGWRPPPNQGPPGPGPEQPPPNWRDGPWPPEPPPLPDFAPDKSNVTKYLLIAVAVLLVIGVGVGATILFTRDSGGGGSTTSSSAVPSDIASANDTGPVAIITDEPTCTSYLGINDGLAKVQSNGWSDQRRTLGPASEWTGDQRQQVDAVAKALRNAANQVVALAKQTPHRVVRELYEQFIAYGRAYADSVPNYTPIDGNLAAANVNIGNALKGICLSITYKSFNRSLSLDPAPNPSGIAGPGNTSDPHKFIGSPESACTAWLANESRFLANTADWEKLDPNIPGSQWTPEQRSIEQASAPSFSSLAGDMESVGRENKNQVIEDFAFLGAQYIRAYVSAGDTYTAADSWLSYTGLRINNAVSGACRASGS